MLALPGARGRRGPRTKLRLDMFIFPIRAGLARRWKTTPSVFVPLQQPLTRADRGCTALNTRSFIFGPLLLP